MTTTKEIRTREFHENELQAIRDRASADAERRREYDDDRDLSAWAEGASIDFHQFALKLIADGMTATFPALYEGDRFVVAPSPESIASRASPIRAPPACSQVVGRKADKAFQTSAPPVSPSKTT